MSEEKKKKKKATSGDKASFEKIINTYKNYVFAIILNFIKDSMISFISLFILWCATGLFVNKIYLYYANKKIDKIKLNNNQKDINELKNICAKKGGTSIGQIFLGLFIWFNTSIFAPS